LNTSPLKKNPFCYGEALVKDLMVSFAFGLLLRVGPIGPHGFSTFMWYQLSIRTSRQ